MRPQSVVFSLGLTVLAGALAFKAYQLDEMLADRAMDLQESQRISEGLIERIQILEPPPYSLSGVEVRSNQRVRNENITTMVLYRFGAQCPHSPKNVPFLNRLHAKGVQVAAVAPSERKPFVEMFAESSGATFPILHGPVGNGLQLLPGGPVPLTALVVEGKLVDLWLGPLDEAEQHSLTQRLGLQSLQSS